MNNHLPAREFLKQKRNLLFSRISLFGSFVALLICIQDFFEGLRLAPFIDLLFALLLLGTYGMNRLGFHSTAKVTTLLMLNFGFAAYASVLPWEIGVFLFYFPVTAMTFGFFEPKDSLIRNAFVGLSFTLILALFLTHFNLFGLDKIEAANPWTSMIINLMASVIASSMCIQFMISINQQAEKLLVQLADEVDSKNKNLEKINKELDRFVYSASHDLRAPLLSLKGLVNLAEMETKDEKLHEYYKMIHNRTEKLDDFITDIINYSRNKSSELNWEPLNVSELIKECTDNLKFMPQAGRIKLMQEVDPAYSYKLDKGRMQVVFNNLISNAIKYHDLSKKDPWIKVAAHSNGKNVTFHVQDNGSGIPLDRQGKLFDMFYRATEESQGSGLGLYIAKEAVEKMGGSISVESQPGHGTSFTVTIPVHSANQPAS